MKKLIVNADDFGYCEAVNYGIIKGFRDGIIRSTTLMCNMPGFDHACSLARQNPSLKIGIHLTLTCYKPLLTTHKTLVKEDGYFDSKNISSFDLEEIYVEWCAQIDRALEAGVHIDHIDSHHHVHTIERLKPVVERILSKYVYPIRGGFRYEDSFTNKTTLIGSFYKQKATITHLEEIIEGIAENETIDMMCHPAYMDQFILDSSSYNTERCQELAILCSPEAFACLDKHNVVLATYSN